MVVFFINTVLWTFALYGFFHFTFSVFRTYYQCKISSKGIYMFIAVKNQENKIEGFIRSILFRLIYGEEEHIDNIFVVDLNSTDKTADILNILSNDYDEIQFTDINGCRKILDSISKAEDV